MHNVIILPSGQLVESISLNITTQTVTMKSVVWKTHLATLFLLAVWPQCNKAWLRENVVIYGTTVRPGWSRKEGKCEFSVTCSITIGSVLAR